MTVNVTYYFTDIKKHPKIYLKKIINDRKSSQSSKLEAKKEIDRRCEVIK